MKKEIIGIRIDKEVKQILENISEELNLSVSYCASLCLEIILFSKDPYKAISGQHQSKETKENND